MASSATSRSAVADTNSPGGSGPSRSARARTWAAASSAETSSAVPPRPATDDSTWSSRVDLPTPGSPYTSVTDPGSRPPARTRSTSPIPVGRGRPPSTSTEPSGTGRSPTAVADRRPGPGRSARVGSSTKLFHAPHSGHRPTQRGATASQSVQRCATVGRAMPARYGPGVSPGFVCELLDVQDVDRAWVLLSMGVGVVDEHDGLGAWTLMIRSSGRLPSGTRSGCGQLYRSGLTVARSRSRSTTSRQARSSGRSRFTHSRNGSMPRSDTVATPNADVSARTTPCHETWRPGRPSPQKWRRATARQPRGRRPPRPREAIGCSGRLGGKS